jgi:hypothetical protein
LNWSEAGERTLFGPDLVKDAEEKVQVIRKNLKLAQMRKRAITIRERHPDNLRWEIMCT